MEITSPSARSQLSMGESLTIVPLVECRSTRTASRPSHVISACWRETPVSGRRKSATVPRPMMLDPGLTSNLRLEPSCRSSTTVVAGPSGVAGPGGTCTGLLSDGEVPHDSAGSGAGTGAGAGGGTGAGSGTCRASVAGSWSPSGPTKPDLPRKPSVKLLAVFSWPVCSDSTCCTCTVTEPGSDQPLLRQ